MSSLNSINPDKLYKSAEARALLACGNTKFWQLINAGELDARKMGRVVVITGSSIAALIERLPRLQPKDAA